jgi:hypothetical protein
VVAIVIAVAPLSFIVLDRPQWSRELSGAGAPCSGWWPASAGVLLAVQREDRRAIIGHGGHAGVLNAMFVLLLGILGWPAGSLYAKYHPASIPNMVNSGWQMLTGAFCLPAHQRGSRRVDQHGLERRCR